MNKSLRNFIIIFLSMLLFTGCTKQKEGSDAVKNLKIGVSFQTLQHEFFVDLKKGIEEEAKKHNIQIIFSDANFQFDKQQSAMEDFASQGVDAVLTVPVNSDSISSSIESVQKRGIPVITLDIGSDKGIEDVYVASDNYLGGKLAAQYLINNLKIEKGNIFVMTAPEDLSIREREEGFKEVIKDYPNLEIATDQHGGVSRDKAIQITENVLQANPDLDIIFSSNDEMTMGALKAVEAAGRQEEIVIIGYDLSNDIAEAIKKGGALKAVTVQQPKLIGETGIKAALDIINGNKTDKIINVEVHVTDKNLLD